MLRRLFAVFGLILCVTPFFAQTLPAAPANLLRNAEFRFYAFEKLRDAAWSENKSHAVPAWETDAWDDIVVCTQAAAKEYKPDSPTDNVVRIHPRKHFRQFLNLPEIGCAYGDAVSLWVQGRQSSGKALRAQIVLMREESEDGKWSPADFKLSDKRTFSKHGRGELVRQVMGEQVSADGAGPFTLKIEDAKINGQVKAGRDSLTENTNAVGLLVDLENLSSSDVLICSPCLARGGAAVSGLASARPLPTFYRQIPRTMEKLWKGEPLHILALGSSVDHGDANPRLYLYDEDPKSPKFKQPLMDYSQSPMKMLGHPELADYIAQSTQRFVYTGRLRLDLMRQFNLPIDKIMLNMMAAGGSSIGESFAGYIKFGDLAVATDEDEGHNHAKTWKELYPGMFDRKEGPRPDLVIFGHGENERVDVPEEPAVFEAAIRLFQRHYPGVECVFCIWPRDGKYINDEPQLRELAGYYGIPYIELKSTVLGLYKTCNPYAICPDGGHPQAGMHFIWSKILGQAFEAAAPLEARIPQRQLPARLHPHAYVWEGDEVTFKAPHPRISGSRMVMEDCAFNLWTSEKNGKATLLIDGMPVDCGAGKNVGYNLQNSSFVHGLLTLGNRHIVEVVGQEPKIVAADCKVCPGKKAVDVLSDRWKRSGLEAPRAFESQWGAPFGDKLLELTAGQWMEIDVTATDAAVAYVDQENGGTLRVVVDGMEALSQATNVPFVDSEKQEHFMENRKAIPKFPAGKHRIRIEAVEKPVSVLGLFTYDSSK